MFFKNGALAVNIFRFRSVGVRTERFDGKAQAVGRAMAAHFGSLGVEADLTCRMCQGVGPG